jgi:hypothetical protein
MLHISPARPEDAHELTLREEDAREVSQYLLGDPVAALAASIDPACTMAFRDPQGRLVGLGGATSDARTLSPWLLCSDRLEAHKASAWRLAKRYVAILQQQADEGYLIYNYIAKDSAQARKFVQALGFVILPSPAGSFDFFYLPPSHV